MDNLIYATIVILVIWAGVFLFLLGLDRRLRRLERRMASGGDEGAGRA
jgi:CcmD family protein